MISRAVLIAVALARFLYIVAAHGGVSDYVVGEKWYKGYVSYSHKTFVVPFVFSLFV